MVGDGSGLLWSTSVKLGVGRLSAELVRNDPPTKGDRRGQEGDRVAQAYLQRGAKAFRERNWVQAADNFHRAAELQPGNARTWYLLALACAENRRWQQQAVNAIDRACELDPINIEYLKLGGRILSGAGLAARAEKFYTAALRWGGPDPSIDEALQKLKKPR